MCYIAQRISSALMYIFKRLSFEGLNYIDNLAAAKVPHRAEINGLQNPGTYLAGAMYMGSPTESHSTEYSNDISWGTLGY